MQHEWDTQGNVTCSKHGTYNTNGHAAQIWDTQGNVTYGKHGTYSTTGHKGQLDMQHEWDIECNGHVAQMGHTGPLYIQQK